MSLIELNAIEFRALNGHLLLQTGDCRFHSTEFTVVAGQTGSGKTCLSRILAGTATATTGSVFLDSQALRRPADFRHASIVLAPQHPDEQQIGRTVREELGFSLGRGSDIGPWLEWAELADQAETFPGCLSFGEQRRLNLALSLAANPAFLLLDDPFMGLDQQFVPRLIQTLVNRHQQGHGVILFSNEIEKVLAHADRMLLLKQGRIIADALPERVLPYLDAHGFRKPTQKLAEMSWLKA